MPQLALFIDVLKVQADVLLGRLKRLRHVLLREPNSFAFEPHIDL
jgi:hypothetical protein